MGLKNPNCRPDVYNKQYSSLTQGVQVSYNKRMQTVPRLHETFQPSHYDLKLDLEREKRTFSGTVTIDGKQVAEGDIALHAKGLEITKATVGETPVAFSIDADGDMVVLNTKELGLGEVSLYLEFHGTITDPMHGLYPCYYEHDGAKKELLATQFESHHAREVFPCIDEPEAKATFDLTLTTEGDVSVLSNMPVREQSSSSDKLTTSFDTTPRMSVYLLAFVVGELQ